MAPTAFITVTSLLLLLASGNYVVVANADDVVDASESAILLTTTATTSTDPDNETNNNNNNKENAIGLLSNVTAWQESGSSNQKLRRGKRYLDFGKGSRMSWRATVKNNILQVNTLWAYGIGLRANFPFPDKEDRRRPFFKRDVLHALSDVMDGHGLDGRACILKSYCTAMLDVESAIGGGMLYKLLKMIFTLDAHDRRHLPYLRTENCHQILHSHCPLSFNSISPYTDRIYSIPVRSCRLSMDSFATEMQLTILLAVFNCLLNVATTTLGNATAGVLRRQRRYLLFEKGASFMVQTNVAKAIVSESPRGLNEIFEYTAMYELPSNSAVWKPPRLSPSSSHYTANIKRISTTSGKAQSLQRKGVSRKIQCHKSIVYREMWHLCDRKRPRKAVANNLFYDLIEQWARIHNFNGRHCIMRSLCEAPHLLLPRGHSLLHDVLRILLRYAQPTAHRYEAYRRAIERQSSLEECVLLYGPHCPISFLRHFTVLVHGAGFAT